jgi:capsule polysaccharide export protein KpsE/RkpR
VKAAEKGRVYFEVANRNRGTRTQNYQTTHNATNWLAKMEVAIDGVWVLCEEEMRIQHILYTCMKFTRRRLTCDCLDKQIPLKAIYEKGDTAAWDEIIKYLKDIKRDV